MQGLRAEGEPAALGGRRTVAHQAASDHDGGGQGEPQPPPAPCGTAGRRPRSGQHPEQQKQHEECISADPHETGRGDEERRQHASQRPAPGERMGLEDEIESPAGRHRHPSQCLHASGPSGPAEAERRAGHEGAQEKRSTHPDQPSRERPPSHSAPDRGSGSPCRSRRNSGGRGRADREDVGAAGDMPVVRRQHAPGHGVGAIREGRQPNAVAPRIGGIDGRASQMDALPARVQHLEGARTRVDPLGEPDHHLARRRAQARIRSGIHRRRNGVRPRQRRRQNRSGNDSGRHETAPRGRPGAERPSAGRGRSDARNCGRWPQGKPLE